MSRISLDPNQRKWPSVGGGGSWLGEWLTHSGSQSNIQYHLNFLVSKEVFLQMSGGTNIYLTQFEECIRAASHRASNPYAHWCANWTESQKESVWLPDEWTCLIHTLRFSLFTWEANVLFEMTLYKWEQRLNYYRFNYFLLIFSSWMKFVVKSMSVITL